MGIGAPPDFWVASRAAQIRNDPERTTFDLIVSHMIFREQLIGLPPGPRRGSRSRPMRFDSRIIEIQVAPASGISTQLFTIRNPRLTVQDLSIASRD